MNTASKLASLKRPGSFYTVLHQIHEVKQIQYARKNHAYSKNHQDFGNIGIIEYIISLLIVGSNFKSKRSLDQDLVCHLFVVIASKCVHQFIIDLIMNFVSSSKTTASLKSMCHEFHFSKNPIQFCNNISSFAVQNHPFMNFSSRNSSRSKFLR